MEKELGEIKKLLEELDDNNFFDKFERINFLTEKIKTLREEMLQQYPRSELKANEAKLNILAKQIKEKLDNIIAEKKQMSEEIKKKLNTLQNLRKISNYK